MNKRKIGHFWKVIFYSLFGLTLLLISCTKDEDCSCNGIVGKRFYYNTTTEANEKCQFVDDIEFTKDGFINLYRTGGGYDNVKMSKVMKYKILNDNCQIKLYDFNHNAILPEPSNCIFQLYLSLIYGFDEYDNEIVIPLTVITCNSFNIGAITLLDYNPR